MRKIGFVALLFIFIFYACKEDDFTYAFPELNQHLVAVTTSGGDWEHRTEFVYDSLNRLSEIHNISVDGQTLIESYKYNDAGKISQKTNENYTTNYVYNTAGQIIEDNVSYISPNDGHISLTKTKYIYKNGKIKKGIGYSEEGGIVSYVSYKYDSRGNTLEKIVRSANSDSDFILYEIKFRYDNEVNPLGAFGLTSLNSSAYTGNSDIIQVNNPTYSLYLNSVMSSFPPEFEVTYEYNSANLPETAVVNNIRYPEQEIRSVLFEYENVAD